jgi:hypothetical protein
MPKFLEEKLKAEYPGNPHAVYGTMNAVGAMKGNKETKKGRAMQAAHTAKVKVHEGFRSVQKALSANPPAAPAKKAAPFGGKQAPPFRKKDAGY